MAKERLQKILARAGIASRRKAEELILEGLVTVNGRVAGIGDQAEFGKDAIKVKGKLIHTVEAPVYLAFNKPRGVISMLADPQGRPTLADFLGKVQARVFPIGRLDFNSEGLILLTNDGAFAEALQKREDVVRVYHAKVKGHPAPEAIERLRRGGRVGYKSVKPHSVRLEEDLANKSRLECVFLGSGAIDLKGLLDLKGFLVERIVRVAIGHITVRGILPGTYRLLKASQVQALLDQPELGMQRLEKERTELHEEREPRRPVESSRPAGPIRPVSPIRPVRSADRNARVPAPFGRIGDRSRDERRGKPFSPRGKSPAKRGATSFRDAGKSSRTSPIVPRPRRGRPTGK